MSPDRPRPRVFCTGTFQRLGSPREERTTPPVACVMDLGIEESSRVAELEAHVYYPLERRVAGAERSISGQFQMEPPLRLRDGVGQVPHGPATKVSGVVNRVVAAS